MPGAFQLGDSYLSVAEDLQNPTENTFLSGALLQELLIPEAAGSEFDSQLQATISPQESGLGLGSQFVSEFFDPASAGWQLDFETNLLAATDNLTISGTSTGVLLINTVVPEPAAVLLYATGLLGLAAIRRRTSALRHDGPGPAMYGASISLVTGELPSAQMSNPEKQRNVQRDAPLFA